MRQVSLGAGLPTVSRFIFGTAALFNVKGGAVPRRRLLEAAAAAGLTHFDTAPLYGFGLAERYLGEAFARRPEVTVTTKVGLYAPGGEDQSETGVWLRKVAGKAIRPMSAAISDASVDRARRSVEGSLRRLRRDKIDLLLIHEPDAAMLDTDAWRRWLEDLITEGKVGAFGVAGETQSVRPFLLQDLGLAQMIQTIDSLDRREGDVVTDQGRPLQITYGYVSAAQRRMPDSPVAQVLEQALARNRTGALIVSTRREDRLGQYATLKDPAP